MARRLSDWLADLGMALGDRLIGTWIGDRLGLHSLSLVCLEEIGPVLGREVEEYLACFLDLANALGVTEVDIANDLGFTLDDLKMLDDNQDS